MEIVFVSESTSMHKPEYEHPENPSRVLRALRALEAFGIGFSDVGIGNADFEEGLRVARRVHSEKYLEYLVESSRRAPVDLDEDTYMSKDSFTLATATFFFAYKYASESSGVFLVSRPPGHHAGREGRALGASSLGFCLLNNAAAAVEGFKSRGFKKIAIIDFDAHHGNGTMEIFYREKVLQVDIHQDPRTLYPYTGYPDELGEGEGYGYKANIVLPRLAGDDLLEAVQETTLSVLRGYTPEALVVSAGFDGFEGDGLADLRLTERSYYALGSLVRELDVPTVVLLEGGYGVGLERGLVAFVNGLLGVKQSYEHRTSTPPTTYRRALETALVTLEKVARRVTRL